MGIQRCNHDKKALRIENFCQLLYPLDLFPAGVFVKREVVSIKCPHLVAVYVYELRNRSLESLDKFLRN